MLKTVKSNIQRCCVRLFDKWEIICFVIGIFAYLAYVFYAYEEVPFESYINKFYLLDLLYSGKLTFKSLLSTYNENGMLAANCLFLLNVKVFHFSVLVESLVNAFLVTVVARFVMFNFFSLLEVKKRTVLYCISIVISTIFLFSCMQQGGGGMSLQVRFGLASFIVTSYMVDRVLQKDETVLYYILTLVMIILSINFFGTAYSFAGIPFIFIIIFVEIIRYKKINLKQIGICGTYIICYGAYFIEYGFVAKDVVTNNYNSNGLLSMIVGMFVKWKDLLISLLYWCGSCVFGRAALEDGHIEYHKYLFVGAIVLVLIVVAIVLYFKTKLYQVTYLPIFWLGYFMVLFAMLFMGRADTLDAVWMTSSWYTVHTKFVPVIVLGIFLYAGRDATSGRVVHCILTGLSCVFLGSTILFGTYCTVVRLPFEKVWIKGRQAYFFVDNKDELPVDESGNTPLFQDQDTSWEAIQLLKKYRLSLFRNYDAYEAMQQIRLQNQQEE